MYFTQEDYKKIENWLHRNSVKDTEFQEALPFTGKEIVTVVQDGHNRKVNIQEFINQLYKHGVEDFLNVTNTYRANNITLKEAIRLIPAEARKEGQVITFLNTEGNWEIYQFTGKLNQWNNTTLWNNPFDWEKLVVDSILPDEEDLTKSEPDAKGNSYLSFKDRKYEPDKYSGLGRKILRRRVVEIENPIYGTQEKNLLLQADFTEDNTVYVVRYDFTLNGQDITLPDNSYIEYEGGSISDGNIIDRAGGLNRVALKKNIVNGKNILTQEMVSTPNTIYEIRYDFTLSENVTIPANCVLKFDGGSISGAYTLTANYTCIVAPLTKIFGLNIDIKGSWKIDGAYPEWFGANPKEAQFDNTAAIQKVLDTRGFKTMFLEPNKRYAVNDINNDGYCLIMQNYTHIIGNSSEIVHFSDNTNPIVFKIAINWNSGSTDARNLSIKGINFSNYDSNWALECSDTFSLYNFLLENCCFYSSNSHSLKIAKSCGYAHSVIRNCSFEGTSKIFMYDRCIIEDSFFSGSGCALDIQSTYGCINNTIQNNTIVNQDGAINLTGVGGARILNNQIEHFQGRFSQHEKMCSIYIKGGSYEEEGVTKYYNADNIIIKDNNLGGGLYLKRSVYIENGVRVVLQDNRIGASCTEEDVYIASSCIECMVRSNFKVGNNLLDVNDNGYRTYGTRRELLELNTEGAVNASLRFTLYEDDTLHLVGNPGNFVFGTNFIVGKFPPGYLPKAGRYRCGNAGGVCDFEITTNGYIKGITYAGTNYNYTFPIFVVDRVLPS